ncbi:MAG: hypothetical protein H7833_12110 [Magnetococcus sp. DMHC-1]|nr:hypothetical protein [Magnetococcales bacterium]
MSGNGFVQESILRALKPEKVTTSKQLAISTGFSSRQVARGTERLVKRDLIIRVDTGRFLLSGNGSLFQTKGKEIRSGSNVSKKRNRSIGLRER